MRFLLLLGVTLFTILQASPPILSSDSRAIFTSNFSSKVETYSINMPSIQNNHTPNPQNKSFTLNYQQTLNTLRLISLVSFGKLSIYNNLKKLETAIYIMNTNSTSITFAFYSSSVTKLAIRVFVAGGLYADPTKFISG